MRQNCTAPECLLYKLAVTPSLGNPVYLGASRASARRWSGSGICALWHITPHNHTMPRHTAPCSHHLLLSLPGAAAAGGCDGPRRSCRGARGRQRRHRANTAGPAAAGHTQARQCQHQPAATGGQHRRPGPGGVELWTHGVKCVCLQRQRHWGLSLPAPPACAAVTALLAGFFGRNQCPLRTA